MTATPGSSNSAWQVLAEVADRSRRYLDRGLDLRQYSDKWQAATSFALND